MDRLVRGGYEFAERGKVIQIFLICWCSRYRSHQNREVVKDCATGELSER